VLPEIGVVLPVAPASETAATLDGTLRSVEAMGYEAVWLRDWPLTTRRATFGDSPPDPATGHDPVAYGAVLRSVLPAAVTVGFAVLRLDFREPAVTARSIVSLASLTDGPVTVGLGGAGSADARERTVTTRSYRAVRALLTFREAADFAVPAAGPLEGMAVKLLVIQYAADTARSSAFYKILGFSPRSDHSDDRWIEHDGVDLAWAVHRAEGDYAPGRHDLSFSTDEPLPALAARLEAAGFETVIKEEPWGPALHTTDPDGTAVMVCGAPG
jgi:hypothetical protein